MFEKNPLISGRRNENIQRLEIAVVILSCDKFRVTWKPCIDHLFNAWPACPHPIYLLNNFVSSNDIRVIDLLTGQDDSWSESLIKGLQNINSERVFFIYDDSFITHLNLQEINNVFETAIKYDLDSVALLTKKFDRGEKLTDEIFKLSPESNYRNSLFLNLIKRDRLLELLRPGENAWQFEKIGNVRSRPFDFYSVYSADLARYRHGIIKGKWLPETYRYLLDKGYPCDANELPVYSEMQVVGLKIYEKAFDTYQRLFHLINLFRWRV